MQWPVSRDQWRFLMRRIRERLWVKPLLICTASIVAVFGAKVSENDMFDGAFTAIARDGAGAVEVEVGIRLQKALRSLASGFQATQVKLRCFWPLALMCKAPVAI